MCVLKIAVTCVVCVFVSVHMEVLCLEGRIGVMVQCVMSHKIKGMSFLSQRLYGVS